MKHEDGDERFCQDGDPVRGPLDDTQQTRHSRCVLDSNPVFYQLMECSDVAFMHPMVKEDNEDSWWGIVENKICLEMDHMRGNLAAAQNQVSNVTQCEFPGLRNNLCVEAGGNMDKSWNLGPSDFRNCHSLAIQSHDLDLPSDYQKVDKGFDQGDSQRSDNFEKDAKPGNSVMTDGISEFDFMDECGGIQLQGKFKTGNNDSNPESLALPNHRSIQLKFDPGCQPPSRQDFPITSRRKMPKKEVVEPPKKVSKCICPECNERFTRVTCLRSHRLKEHGQKPFSCKECGMQYMHKQTFRLHRRLHVGENLFTCTHCDKKFVLKSQLEHHAVVHEVNRKQFTCQQCGKHFLCSKSLISHIERCPADIRNTVNNIYCSVCNKGFRFVKQLEVHTRMAHGAIFPCFECNKRFHKESTLKVHTLMCHFFEKPFTCNVCDKQFTRRIAGFGHLRIHTGEKPYVCDKCNIGFTLKCTLNRHARIHTGKKPYVCDKCDRGFKRRTSLNRHAKIHTVIGTGFTSYGRSEHSAWKPSNLPATFEEPREDHCKKTNTCKEIGKSWEEKLECPRIPGQVDVRSVNHAMNDSQLK